MKTTEEKQQFLEQGFLHVPGILQGEHLARVQSEFDRVWDEEHPPINQHKLLKHQTFIDLIEHAPILERHQAIFGHQTQLLQFDLLRQAPGSTFPHRAWHRDFAFPGDIPLSVNTILFLNDIDETVGLTRVVPGSQRGTALPPSDKIHESLPDETGAPCKAGDAIFINSAIWHSGGRNKSQGLRRGIYLYYGYWWLKRYENTTELPWQALHNASETRLQLLGIKMPANDLHQYQPDF